MTNEQLAAFIYAGGNDELIPILWDNVRRLLYRLADGYYRAFSDTCSQYGLTAWDLKQAAYPAFLKAVEAYGAKRECGYKFTAFLRYPFKNAVRCLLTNDMLNRCSSLNEEAYTDSDNETELLDIIPDESSLDPFEQVEEASRREVVRAAVSSLPKQERQVISLHYFSGKSYKEIGNKFGLSAQRISSVAAAGIKHLRNNREIRKLGDELGYTSHRIYHDSLCGFKRSGVSAVELVASQRADIERKQRIIDEVASLYEAYSRGDLTQSELLEAEAKLDREYYGVL